MYFYGHKSRKRSQTQRQLSAPFGMVSKTTGDPRGAPAYPADATTLQAVVAP
jgi:hypothetical protein